MILASAPAFADVIHLKNGRAVEGEIVEQTDSYVEVRLKTLTAKFDLKDVQSVEKKELPGNFFVSEVSTRYDKLKAEGYSEMDNSPYKIMTKATYDKFKDLVEIEGDIDLPEKATLYVALKKDNNIVDSLQTAVTGNKFAVRFGPFVNPLAAGDYKVETVYLQPEKTKSVKAGQAGKEVLKAVCKVTVKN